jgi:putative two-component system response regulator
MATLNRKQAILVVDDIPDNIDILSSILKPEYRVKVATSGRKTLEIAASRDAPDMILLDVMMPDMDGFEVCVRLKENPVTRKIPVIFVTSKDEIVDETIGFLSGGVDYILKPVSSPIVQARVRTHLALYDQSRILERKVLERTRELNETRLEIIQRLGQAAEYKDNEIGLHIIRMSRYAQLIADEYGLPAQETELIYNAAPMHDVGKIGIPDAILRKPGPLNEEEWKIMRTHCQMGLAIIGVHKSDLLYTAGLGAHTHHEKWDGSGYPRGLKGDKIPLIGRILAVADVFDALTSVRPYKKAWDLDKAVNFIQIHSGKHFDPDLVFAFEKQIDKIIQIKQEIGD